MSNYQKMSDKERREFLSKVHDVMLYSDRAYKVFLHVLSKEIEYCEEHHIPLSTFNFNGVLENEGK